MRSRYQCGIPAVLTALVLTLAGCGGAAGVSSAAETGRSGDSVLETDTSGGAESETGGPAESVSESEAAASLPEDAVTLRVYDKNATGESFDDAVAQQIMEKTGVKMEVVSAGTNSEEELEVMLNNRSYPDIVLMAQGDMVNRYIDAGAFIPLDDLVEEYGDNIRSMYGGILERSEYTDGQLYWFANWYGEDNDASAGVLIRRDLLAAVAGEERAASNEPFTLSEYTELLRRFAEQYPYLEGHESIPLVLDTDAENYEVTLKAIYGMKTYGENEEGKLIYLPTDARYQEALMYLNSLYTEGLLDKEWIIDRTERWTSKLEGGYVFSTWGSYWDTDAVNEVLKEQYGEEAQFYSYKVVADGLSASATTYNARSSLGWDAIGITDNCEHPEAAMKVLDYLASEEGQYLMLWGIEGDSWTMQDGKHVPEEEFLERWEQNSAATEQETGVRRWTWMIRNGSGSDGTPYDLTSKYALSDTAEFANASFGASDTWDTAEFAGLEPPVSSELGIKWLKVQSIYSENYQRIICASDAEEAQTLYGKMTDDMEDAGLPECEAYIRWQYRRRMKRWNS